jgi:hypothetical protein
MFALRWIFVTLPCILWDAWWTAYRIVLAVGCMVTVTLTVLTLLLELVGVRWGW